MNNFLPINWKTYEILEEFLEKNNWPKLNQEEIANSNLNKDIAFSN